jgi:translation initiation factor IF-1
MAENKVLKETSVTIPDEVITEFKTDHDYPIPENVDKFEVAGDRVVVPFETRGRFDTPAILKFEDYSTRDISNLIMSKGETLIETLIAILSERSDDPNFRAENMLMEEFYEVLIGLKAQFAEDGRNYSYQWMCKKCQSHVDERDRVLSKINIDLGALKYTSIEDAEEAIRAELKSELERYTPEQFQHYLRVKYKDEESRSIDQVVKEFKIKEPMYLLVGKTLYEMRFSRIGDLARAIKIASNKYNSKIRAVRARPGRHGVPGATVQAEKDEEISKLEEEKEKETVLISQSLCLVRKDGMDLNYEQRIQEFGKIPKNIFGKYADFRSKMRFGLQDERSVECNLCGHTEKRLLHRDIDFVSLLPFQSNEGSVTSRESKNITSAIVFM